MNRTNQWKIAHIFRLYERDPFTNKPIKSDVTSPSTELTIPTVANTTLLVPGQTTTFNTIPTHTNGCSSLIFPNQSVSSLITFTLTLPFILDSNPDDCSILITTTSIYLSIFTQWNIICDNCIITNNNIQ